MHSIRFDPIDETLNIRLIPYSPFRLSLIGSRRNMICFGSSFAFFIFLSFIIFDIGKSTFFIPCFMFPFSRIRNRKGEVVLYQRNKVSGLLNCIWEKQKSGILRNCFFVSKIFIFSILPYYWLIQEWFKCNYMELDSKFLDIF